MKETTNKNDFFFLYSGVYTVIFLVFSYLDSLRLMQVFTFAGLLFYTGYKINLVLNEKEKQKIKEEDKTKNKESSVNKVKNKKLNLENNNKTDYGIIKNITGDNIAFIFIMFCTFAFFIGKSLLGGLTEEKDIIYSEILKNNTARISDLEDIKQETFESLEKYVIVGNSNQAFEKKLIDEISNNKTDDETKNIEEISDDIKGYTGLKKEIKLVGNVYTLSVFDKYGSTNKNINNLQIVLNKLGYYNGEINGDFSIATKSALAKTLIIECSWPETTKGIFGLQAKKCIDNLKIETQ